MSNLSLREIAQSQLDSTPVIDGQLIVCLDTGNAYRDTATAHVKIGSDLEVVSDLPLAPLAEKIYYLKPDKLYVFLGGNWTLLNDKTIDLDEAIAKLPAESSTTLNDDVEIITQDTDITQPHYYRRKLVVLWKYIKTKAQDFFAAKNHQHGKADITDFPTSMPASDVYPWAKAATKPSYTKAEVGLGKVDNTADADKTVKRATTSGTADSANSVAWKNVRDKPTTFPVEAHNHDDRYYTEAEIDGKLEKKSSTDHTHDLSELISALSIDSSTTLNDSVQIITQDTDTANQKYYRRPLTVLWNYIKSKADSVYSAIGHNHKIQNLEDYTTRVYDATIVRPADTVLASPQDKDGIATFRKLDKNDVGLENVDNTADKNKNVATAGIATTGVRDYNNANNIIKIGWSGTELDADSLAYVAGYTSDKKIHPASKDGVRSWLGLGDSAYKNTKSRSSKGSTDWTNNATDDAIVPTMSFMAYWDGAYNSNGASNLSYCDRGRFGTIVTKNTEDYLSVSGGTMSGPLHINPGSANNYSEGVRIHSATDGWTTLMLCGTDNTGNNGTSAKSWSFHTKDGAFGLAKNGTGLDTNSISLTCKSDNVWRANDVPILTTDNGIPKSGGTISGALNFANGTWNLVGDDAYMGDHNIGGSFCIMGANDTTRLALVNKDNQGDYALVEYGGGNLNFNKKLGANITGHADGDLALSGGTMSNGATITFADSGTWSAGNGTYPRDCGGFQWTGQSDSVHLYAEETGGDNLELVMQFGDDNSNGLSIRNNVGGQTSRIDASGNATFNSSVTANTYYAPNWFRATGDSGFYFENHGGGWYMIDDTWIRAYNNKNIYTPGVIQCDSGFNGNLNGHASRDLALSGGTMSGQITKSTGGSWIGDRDRAAIKSSYAGDSSYGAVAAMATKNGYWTMGNLGGNESLIFNYSTDANYIAGNNNTAQVYLPAQAGTIITSATIGNQTVNTATYANYLNFTYGNEINFNGTPSDNTVYVGYRNTSIREYRFNNGAGNGGLASITAAAFNGKATSAGSADSATTSNGIKDYNDGNRTIQIGFAGDGLNASNLNYIAGYTDNGTKIKDVSKDVLKGWIGQVASATSAGNGVVASGSNYVRFGDGTQICWYTNLSSGSILFYVPFIDTNYAIVAFKSNGVDIDASYSKKTSTSVEVFFVDNIVCIGRWK